MDALRAAEAASERAANERAAAEEAARAPSELSEERSDTP
jgi:hypothetical protein